MERALQFLLSSALLLMMHKEGAQNGRTLLPVAREQSQRRSLCRQTCHIRAQPYHLLCCPDISFTQGKVRAPTSEVPGKTNKTQAESSDQFWTQTHSGSVIF